MTKYSYVVFLQELALSSFTQMASVLKKESNNSLGFAVISATVGSVLSGIANVLQSSASLASVDATDSKENLTGYTGNSTEGGVVSVKDRVSIIRIRFHCFFHSAFAIPMVSHPQLKLSIIQLGRHRILEKGDPLQWVPYRGSGGIFPWKILKIETLGISSF